MPGVSPGPPVSSRPLTHSHLVDAGALVGGRSRGQTDPLPRAPAPVVSVWGCTDSLEVWSHVHTRCQRHLQGRGGLRFIRAPCDVRLCGSILQCCPWPPRPHSRTFRGVSLRVSQLCPSWTWLPRAHLRSGLPEPRPASSRQRPSLANLHPRCCVPGVGLTVPKPGTTCLSQEQWEATAGF